MQNVTEFIKQKYMLRPPCQQYAISVHTHTQVWNIFGQKFKDIEILGTQLWHGLQQNESNVNEDTILNHSIPEAFFHQAKLAIPVLEQYRDHQIHHQLYIPSVSVREKIYKNAAEKYNDQS